MRYETHTVRIGENVGPVDWSHPTAEKVPAFWVDAEQRPGDFLFRGRPILSLCMYDGWPYWQPRPAIQFIGPLNRAEWAFFDSYGVHPDSIAPIRAALSSEAQPLGAAGEAEAALQHRMSPNPPPPHPIGNGEAG